MRGDHFVVRDETAQRTLGGGMVVHPWAERHKRAEPGLLTRLQSLQNGSFAEIVEGFLTDSAAFALPIDALYQFLNLREEEARQKIDALEGVRALNAEGEKVYTTETKWRAIQDQLVKTLQQFHAAHSLVPGMDMEELRGKLKFELAPKIFRVIVELFVNQKLIAKEGSLLRLTSHRVQLGGQEKTLMERIKRLLAEQPLAPPDLKEIERQAGVPRHRLNEVIRLLEREGAVIRVTSEMYFLAESIEQLRQTLIGYLSKRDEMTAAGFRDLIGSSRKYTIPLLEFFDRDGLTIRIGDIRRLKSPPR
jgi:selenocysteine-specific elongation factor